MAVCDAELAVVAQLSINSSCEMGQLCELADIVKETRLRLISVAVWEWLVLRFLLTLTGLTSGFGTQKGGVHILFVLESPPLDGSYFSRFFSPPTSIVVATNIPKQAQ